MELLLFLSSFLLLLSPLSSTPTTTITLSDTIQRTQTQQLLATIPSTSPQPNQPFLTSPSATYTAYLCRTATASSTTGDLANSSCFIQVRDTSTGKSVWNSECTPVSAANACALAFADVGLELYDGSHAVWDTGVHGINSSSESTNYSNNNNNYYYYLSALTLDDEGDMQLADSNGEPVWKSNSETQVNQGCGLPGSSYGENGQQSSSMSLSPPVDTSSSASPLPPPSDSDEINQPPSPASSDLPGSPASIFSSPASPELPIASPPIAGGSSGGLNGNLPFGQQQLQGGNGLNQALVDHNAYDSGCSRKEGAAAAAASAMGMVLVTVGLFVHGFGL